MGTPGMLSPYDFAGKSRWCPISVNRGRLSEANNQELCSTGSCEQGFETGFAVASRLRAVQ